MQRKKYPVVSYLHEDRPGKLGSRLLDFSQIGRRDLVDQTGLIGGIYINTSASMERADYICRDNNSCISELVALESRIQMAYDEDKRIYTLQQLEEEDEDIVDLLQETNLKVIYCVKHHGALMMPLIPDTQAPSAVLYNIKGQLINVVNGNRGMTIDQVRPGRSQVIDLKEWKKKNKPQPPAV
jgi:hypothetical protein